MNAHIVIGDGVWPIDTVLHRALSPERRREVIVLDLQGRGAGRLTDALRAELQERLQVWLDLAERRAPRAPWRYRPSEQGDRSLRFLVQGWAASVGVEVPVVEVQALVAMARALGTIARDPLGTAPSLSLVDVVRALRDPPHPLLLRRLAETADVDAMRLRPLLDGVATALRYPAVYACVSSSEAVPPPRPAGVTWIELPRAHLEPVEWQLLARLAVAAAMESCASRERPVVVVIDPTRGAGTCVDPAWFSGADAVYGAWTPTGDGSEAVLRPWARAKAWIARNRLRPDAWESLIAAEAHAALRSLSECEMLATALRPDAPWTRHRFRAPAVLEAPPRERLRRPESAPTHLADAAVEAMRERTVPRGLLPRIASLSSLRRAWHRVRTGNVESFGTDFVSARTFEMDLEPALLSLRAELLDGTYRPLPLRRVNPVARRAEGSGGAGDSPSASGRRPVRPRNAPRKGLRSGVRAAVLREVSSAQGRCAARLPRRVRRADPRGFAAHPRRPHGGLGRPAQGRDGP